MKRIVLSGVMLLAVGALASAIGLSLFAGGAYGFGLDNETYGTSVSREPHFGDYLHYRNRFYAHAQGVRALAGIGVAFTNGFLVEIGGGYFPGRPDYFAHYSSDFAFRRETEMTTSFFPVFLTMKGQVPVGRFSFHFGGGPSVGLFPSSRITDFVGEDHLSLGYETGHYWELDATSTTGWGFHAVAGAEFRVTRWLYLRAEVRGEQLTFRPKKSVITAYTVDGEDRLVAEYPDVYDRETIYVDDLSAYLNNPIDPNAPRQELARNVSADGVIGFVGLVFRLGSSQAR